MNEEMEYELTKMDSIPENLVVSEDASVDESVPIYLRKEKGTEAYKETMGNDIDNIDTYETRTKFNTTKCRPIHEVVIDEAYIKDSKISPDDFIKECKNNSNETHDITREVNNNIK